MELFRPGGKAVARLHIDVVGRAVEVMHDRAIDNAAMRIKARGGEVGKACVQRVGS